MVKLVVTWENIMGDIFVDVIDVQFDNISSDNIEKIIKEERAPKREKTFDKIISISQLFDPDRIVRTLSRSSGLTGPF